MSPAIRVNELGKRFAIAASGGRASYRTLREELMTALRSPLQQLGLWSEPTTARLGEAF